MYKVKLTPYRPGLGTILYRQTQGHSLTSLDGRYRFYVNEPVDDPDFWVVQGKGVREPQTSNVAPQNTILLTTEPASVLVYPKKYTRQFGLLCTCQPRLSHPNKKLTPPILPWFVGYHKTGPRQYLPTQDYDSLKQSSLPEKTKLISVITSNKAFTQGHVDRIRFVQQLKAHYGDQLDVFGRGFCPFDDKWDVLAPYQYHIVIENSSEPYYWTEKLGDCFLTGTFPLYYGCTNVDDYFPRDAYEPIDIHDVDGTISLIDRLVGEHRYEQSLAALQKSRDLMLDDYNLFEFIARTCDQMDATLPKQQVTIRPCHSTDSWRNVWNYVFTRNFFKLKMKLKGGDRWLTQNMQ